MRYFPFFLRLNRLRTLVVGGGGVALSKVRLLVRSGACLTLVAPRVGAELRQLLAEHGAALHRRPFCVDDLDDCDIVVCATANETLNEQVWQAAKDRGRLINVVDQAARCDFIFPAIVERGDLIFAVSTSGTAPVIANSFRTWIDQRVDASWEVIMKALRRSRDRITAAFPDLVDRRRFYHALVEDHQGTLFGIGDEGIDEHIDRIVHGGRAAKVYLVGAGPGAADLLTLRAHRLLQQADVIFYDRLVGEDILQLARREAERIYVGKRRNNHHVRQPDINRMLVEHASRGRVVVRLKGGDPFVFGRGGEEMLFLERHGIAVEVIPGVSAANGCAAQFKIPLTMRQVANQLSFLTVHKDSLSALDWRCYAQPDHSLALYMSLETLPQVCRKLLQHGADPRQWAAVIQKGTLSGQKMVRATLADIAAGVPISLQSPVITIIGPTVTADVGR